MKKFLSILLLAATIHYIYAEKQEHFFLKDGDQFLLCDINKEGDEECCPFDIEALKKMNDLIAENEKKAEELTKNIMNAQVRYMFFMLVLMNNLKWQKRSQKSTNEERKTQEEVIPIPEGCVALPNALSDFLRNGIKKSMLSEKEQEMFDELQKINRK